jgi:hypothetical protein
VIQKPRTKFLRNFMTYHGQGIEEFGPPTTKLKNDIGRRDFTKMWRILWLLVLSVNYNPKSATEMNYIRLIHLLFISNG